MVVESMHSFNKVQTLPIRQKVARNLAKIPDIPWNKVEHQLLSACPQPSEQREGSYTLTSDGQAAVISLGIFLLESNFQHRDRILDYLLKLELGLATALFPDENSVFKSHKLNSQLPQAETFSFCLNTILNDVAASSTDSIAERIIESQVTLLNNIVGMLQEMKSRDNPYPFNTRRSTCKCVVPVLIGLVRALARYGPLGDFLTNKIFENLKFESVAAQDKKLKKTFSNFRSIIPRSLSSTFQPQNELIESHSSESVVDLSFRPNLRSDLMCYQTEKQREQDKMISFQSQASVQPYDPSTYFFHKVGSSFNQLQAPLTRVYKMHRDSDGIIRFKEATLRNIFQIILKVLAKDMLEFLDGLSHDIYSSGSIKIFPYKSLRNVSILTHNT